jgi:hypothetical protein
VEHLGGLDILNLRKFCMVVRLWWLWDGCVNDFKAWIGMGNPCIDHAHGLFTTATVVTIGDGSN